MKNYIARFFVKQISIVIIHIFLHPNWVLLAASEENFVSKKHYFKSIIFCSLFCQNIEHLCPVFHCSTNRNAKTQTNIIYTVFLVNPPHKAFSNSCDRSYFNNNKMTHFAVKTVKAWKNSSVGKHMYQ